MAVVKQKIIEEIKDLLESCNINFGRKTSKRQDFINRIINLLNNKKPISAQRDHEDIVKISPGERLKDFEGDSGTFQIRPGTSDKHKR